MNNVWNSESLDIFVYLTNCSDGKWRQSYLQIVMESSIRHVFSYLKTNCGLSRHVKSMHFSWKNFDFPSIDGRRSGDDSVKWLDLDVQRSQILDSFWLVTDVKYCPWTFVKSSAKFPNWSRNKFSIEILSLKIEARQKGGKFKKWYIFGDVGVGRALDSNLRFSSIAQQSTAAEYCCTHCVAASAAASALCSRVAGGNTGLSCVQLQLLVGQLHLWVLLLLLSVCKASLPDALVLKSGTTFYAWIWVPIQF